MSFAVIKTGGKQYRVEKGDIVAVERLKEAEAGTKFLFDEVLLRSDGKNVEIGTPIVGNPVEAKVLGEKKGEKKIIFRYHAKTRYRKLKGHRQLYTLVEIISV